MLLETLDKAPRVAIVPTASAPDGNATFDRWLCMVHSGHQRFAPCLPGRAGTGACLYHSVTAVRASYQKG